jgi:hypothetical protein
MKKYEYMIQELQTNSSPKTNDANTLKLNELGEMGWELVAVTPLLDMKLTNSALFFFRRANQAD